MTSVLITRPRHPLLGRSLRVLGRIRRHGRLELLLVLPDGSKRLIPQAWTDAEPGAVPEGTTLGSLTDLLAACALVAGLAERGHGERGQAARKSPSKEDFRAACPAEFDTRPELDASGNGGRAATRAVDRRGDHAAGRRDRQDRRPAGAGGGQ